jgi:indole-3-glycerol phosphate synthase
MGMIEELVEAARTGAEGRSAEVPLEELERRLAERPEQRPFGEALVRPGLSVIAEFKRRSPSVGDIRRGATPAGIARA